MPRDFTDEEAIKVIAAAAPPLDADTKRRLNEIFAPTVAAVAASEAKEEAADVTAQEAA